MKDLYYSGHETEGGFVVGYAAQGSRRILKLEFIENIVKWVIYVQLPLRNSIRRAFKSVGKIVSINNGFVIPTLKF